MENMIKYLPDSACDNCGAFGVYDLGEQKLCSDCYQIRGSCCMEFGGNDMWSEECSPEKKNE